MRKPERRSATRRAINDSKKYVAAVRTQALSLEVPRIVPCEEHVSRNDISHLRNAPERYGLSDSLERVGGYIVQYRRQGRAGRDTVDGDVARADLEGGAAGEGNDGALRCRVGTEAGGTLVRELRRRVDDATRVAGVHLAEHRASHHERTAQMHAKHPIPGLGGHLVHRSGCSNACIVYENIDVSEGIAGGSNQSLDLSLLADIGAHDECAAPGLTNRGRHLLGRRGLSGGRVIDDDIRALYETAKKAHWNPQTDVAWSAHGLAGIDRDTLLIFMTDNGTATGAGVSELEAALAQWVTQNPAYGADTVVSHARHAAALRAAADSLSQAENALRTGLSGELVAIDLRDALRHIGSITGQVVADDLLTSIFSRFCIGK